MPFVALQGSGPISLGNVQTEFGGTNPVNFSEYYRGGTRVPNNSFSNGIAFSGQISLSSFYGTGKVFQHTITSSQADLDLYAYLLTQGWDGVGFVEVTVNAGVWVYSTNTANGGLIISSSFTSEGLIVYNYGRIIGMGGRGGDSNDSRISNFNRDGGAGGPAITNAATNLEIFNYSGAYIAGGGGGGGGGSGGDRGKNGGGGGAGGGDGGRGLSGGTTLAGGAGGSIGNSGSDSPTNENNTGGRGSQAGASGSGTNVNDGGDNDSAAGGGGGGRVLPGNGVDARIPTGFGADYPGGHGGGALQVGGLFGRPFWLEPNFVSASDPCRSGTGDGAEFVAGGGGGWGAAGGNGDTARGGGTGGAAGVAISSTQSYSLTNSGTIYGAT
jgi:hypothetical protein